MRLSRLTILLFALNFLDAVLTVFWVHNDYAFEGNQLMAGVLDFGYAPFLLVKIGIGALAAVVISRWKNLPAARYGLSLALAVYAGVMGIHFFTGLSAFGFLSDASVIEISAWSQKVIAFFV